MIRDTSATDRPLQARAAVSRKTWLIGGGVAALVLNAQCTPVAIAERPLTAKNHRNRGRLADKATSRRFDTSSHVGRRIFFNIHRFDLLVHRLHSGTRLLPFEEGPLTTAS